MLTFELAFALIRSECRWFLSIYVGGCNMQYEDAALKISADFLILDVVFDCGLIVETE